MESLVDVAGQVPSFVEDQKLTYDPGKRVRGETWEPEADARARRHFRDLLIAVQSSLDALADLIALFFTGYIPGLRFGRAQFARVEEWLKRPLPSLGLILTPYDEPLRELFDALHPLIHTTGPEREWLPLMRLMRNKAAHLGQPVFRQVDLQDETAKFYTFLPRKWPYIWERHIKPAGSPPPSDPEFIPKHFRETLMHQDVTAYATGLRAKVREVVRAGVSRLSDVYNLVQDFDPNHGALAELQGSSESYGFEYFVSSVLLETPASK